MQPTSYTVACTTASIITKIGIIYVIANKKKNTNELATISSVRGHHHPDDPDVLMHGNERHNVMLPSSLNNLHALECIMVSYSCSFRHLLVMVVIVGCALAAKTAPKMEGMKPKPIMNEGSKVCVYDVAYWRKHNAYATSETLRKPWPKPINATGTDAFTEDAVYSPNVLGSDSEPLTWLDILRTEDDLSWYSPAQGKCSD